MYEVDVSFFFNILYTITLTKIIIFEVKTRKIRLLQTYLSQVVFHACEVTKICIPHQHP